MIAPNRSRPVRRSLLPLLVVLATACTTGALRAADGDAMDLVSRSFLRPTRTLITLRAPPSTTLVPIQFAAADDTVLRGTLYDRAGADDVVLVVGGISGNHTWFGPYADALATAGFDVMLFDPRGFGASDGDANAATLVADARAAYHHLIDARGYARERSAVFGISLGSVLALAIARDERPRAVVVEDLFLPAEMFDRLKARLTKNVLGKLAAAWVETALLPTVDPIANARAYDGPMLFVAGSADPISKPASTIRVAKERGRPSRVWIAPLAGHAPEVLLGYDLEYAAQLNTFLRGALRASPSPHVAVRLDPTSSRAAGIARIAVTSSAKTVAQIAVSDGTRFAFAVHEVPAGETEVAVAVDFAPRHVFASIVHHFTRRANGACVASASPFAASMARYASFEQRFDAELARIGRKLASDVAARRLFDAIEDDLPEPRTIHAAVRPRYARKLAGLANVLLESNAGGSHEFALRVGSFLPEHPDAWTGYGDHGFEGGFRDAASADLCARLAPIVAAAGHVDAASDFERRAAAMKP